MTREEKEILGILGGFPDATVIIRIPKSAYPGQKDEEVTKHYQEGYEDFKIGVLVWYADQVSIVWKGQDFGWRRIPLSIRKVMMEKLRNGNFIVTNNYKGEL